MIQINSSISIAEKEIKENFIRAPGPGGQKVNKTEVPFSCVSMPEQAHPYPTHNSSV